MGIPKDKREKMLSQLEKKIQSDAKFKDAKFMLKGKWKKFVRKQDGFRVFIVNGDWVRHNLCVYFDHGGHGFVHEFVPFDEIWISSHHNNSGKDKIFNCSCKTRKVNQKISANFFESTLLHEIVEFKEMKKGKTYWESHQIALGKEKKLGLLKSPFDDS